MCFQITFLLLAATFYCVCGLESYCYHYYSEFSLDEHYNPTIYPEVNTTITDITTLYKVSEVIYISNKQTIIDKSRNIIFP